MRMRILIAAVAMMAGCADSPTTSAPASSGVFPLTVDADPVDPITLSQPQVRLDGNVLTVTGTITRKPAQDAAVPGQMDLAILDQNGQTMYVVPMPFTPADIPTDGDRSATYSINWGSPPPPGGSLHVAYDDDSEDDSTDAGGRQGQGGHVNKTLGDVYRTADLNTGKPVGHPANRHTAQGGFGFGSTALGGGLSSGFQRLGH